MLFEWSKSKRTENLTKHGVDLVFAALIFEGPVLTQIDDRNDYGETRYISVGLIDDEAYVVVHTTRGDRTRLISAWLGGQKANGRYKARFP
ncbi:BrnT family toxin [Roseicyclus sp.]|uniref:BrnT family toxin n=1 Tax=Roseicyclus sp. TaxID=1914329 RepID=UPI003F6AEFFA